MARYLRNCQCYAAHISRKKKQGLLQPLPMADRYWTQISMDFMVDLPAAGEDDLQYLLVITDRLSKYIQLEALSTMEAPEVAKRFRDVWRFHGFPVSIISDRGSDWVGQFWSSLCEIVGIEQLLSTAHHPQTDGGTERANQEVQAVLRMMVCFEQTDWPDCLPACQLALNNRDSTVTGISPNLLLHGYNLDLLQGAMLPEVSSTMPKGRAAQFVGHLKEGLELAQAAIAYAQQRAQESADRSRRPAEKYEVGDKVWFNLRHVKTNRPSKKFDWLRAKYTVQEVPTPLTVVLDLPGSLVKKVHVDLIEKAADDPLPSQHLRDARPGPKLVLSEEDPALQEEQWEVEEILRAGNARGRDKRQVYVKWKGWVQPTWEPLEELQDTEALHRFEEKWGSAVTNDGPPRRDRRRKARKN